MSSPLPFVNFRLQPSLPHPTIVPQSSLSSAFVLFPEFAFSPGFVYALEINCKLCTLNNIMCGEWSPIRGQGHRGCLVVCPSLLLSSCMSFWLSILCLPVVCLSVPCMYVCQFVWLYICLFVCLHFAISSRSFSVLSVCFVLVSVYQSALERSMCAWISMCAFLCALV